ncbi:putative lipoprotein [Sinobacterium caligoides]|uniref:Putative lipoprotein n=1 Tax=Sinobacterium caligoides TaxID=933926 RepID=A0A3N2DQX1_9GAMM|nr:lipoprotein [Sinobacterium caligoides]ROS01999.1 putative lipoprotein [Sinobacterium caligoides]
MRTLLAVAILSLFISGCGQKGPLTLPSDTPAKDGEQQAPKPHVPDIFES